MFFVLSWVWEKEKNLSTHEELNLRPSDSVLHFCTTEPQRLYAERGLLQSSYDMLQHTARISNVNSVKFVNRIKERISFEVGKEMEKDVFVLSQVWVNEENVSSHKESNLRPSESTLCCSITEPHRLYGEQGLLWSSLNEDHFVWFRLTWVCEVNDGIISCRDWNPSH